MDHNAIDMDQMGFPMPPPPPLQHPPPQIFGSYLLDSLPDLQHLPSDYAAHMFPDHILMDEGAEAKKRRISKACDMCRKKKIKCDGKLPSCTHCINYKTQCIFTQTEKKRTPPKGAKYIEGLENRLGRMEHLLRLSGLLDEDEDDLGALEKRLMEKSRQESLVQTPDLSWPSRETPAQDASDSPRSCLMSSGAANRDDDQGGDEDGDRDKDKDRGRGKDRDKGYGERERQTEKEGVRERPREREREREMERGRDGSRPKLAGPSVERQEEEQEVETLSEMMCSLVTNQSGDSRYIGSSSGFSIFSPKGVQWVNSKTGDDSFRNMISHVSEDDHKWTNWKPEVFGDVFERRIFRPLPGREEALRLLGDYFDNFNCMMPLFHQPTFMQLVERQYSADPYQGTGWWASLNATLAIAHRLRVMSGLDPAEEDDKGWGYLKNAMACFAELTMRNTDLLSVQALLGMALFLQGTPNPQPTSRLIAAAMRLSHSIGLHRRGTGFDLNPIEIEQRRRVFWIGYMLDKDLSLRSGQPPAQEDDDMSVELPDAEAPDGIGIIPLADGKGQMSLFRVLCEFAVIESSVYKRLYSAKASRQSDGELLSTIGELDQQLEEWKDRIPVEFRPEHPIQASHTPLILHVVMLHLAYYNCLTTIHRMSVQHGIWTSRLANYAIQGLNVRPLNPRIFSSAALCTSAARASISLLKYIPQGDFSCVWMIIYFPISALVVLFGNILQSPLNAKARSDVKLMKLVVSFLSMLGQEAEQGGVHRMLGVCSEFCRVAESVIDKADKEHAARRKRKNLDSSQAKTAPMVPSQTPQPTARASPFMPMRSVSGASSPPGMDVGWVHPQQVLLQQQPQQPQPQQYGMGMDSAHSSPMSGIHVLQQPLIPPNLFSLQMSLDWTWAEMSGGAYPSVENGNPSLFG